MTLKLKAELNRLRISQAECARRANINQTSLSRILLGKEPPCPHRSKRIADAIGWKDDPAKLFEEVADNDSHI